LDRVKDAELDAQHDTKSSVMPGARWQSLRHPNYRLYIIGQMISGPGGWLQTVAIAWLVLDRLPGATHRSFGQRASG